MIERNIIGDFTAAVLTPFVEGDGNGQEQYDDKNICITKKQWLNHRNIHIICRGLTQVIEYSQARLEQ